MRLRFILSEAFSGLRRNATMAVAVVIVTFVSLTFVGAAILLQKQIDVLTDDWYDKVEISVFMCPQNSSLAHCAGGEATADQIDAVEGLIAGPDLEPHIAQWYLETKEEAYAAAAEQLADDYWFEYATVDDMAVSFRIKLVDPQNYQVIADVLSQQPGVDHIVDQRSVLEPIFRLLDRATLVAAGLAILMLLAAVLLITTTIRLSAMSRRRETSIMRFVGASALFIQLPFMAEGAVAATLGAGLAVGALWYGSEHLVAQWLGESFQWMKFIDGSDALAVAPWLLVIGIGLALVASITTLSRYAKV